MRSLSIVSKSIYNEVIASKKTILKIDDQEIRIALIDIPEPEFDEDEENFLLVKKLGFSLNYRDIGYLSLANKQLKNNETNFCLPFGSDFVGVIEKLGKNITSFNVGDIVINNNSFGKMNSSFQGIPSNSSSLEKQIIHESKVVKLPANIDIELGASLSIGIQTSISMIRKANIQPSDKILVTSASSSTSQFILSLLNLLKLENEIYILTSKEEKIIKLIKQHKNITKGFAISNGIINDLHLFDVVFDPFADLNLPFLLEGKNLNFDCRYITCGFYAQSDEKRSQLNQIYIAHLVGELLLKNISLIGNCLGTEEDILFGLDLLNENKSENIVFKPLVFKENDSIDDFISNSFNIKNNKFGKVSFIY